MATSPNKRQRIIQFTTPKVSDLVVVETVDASRNVSSSESAVGNLDDQGNPNVPYGTLHPNQSKSVSVMVLYKR